MDSTVPLVEALLIVVDNACRVTPTGGRIALRAEGAGGRVVLRVSDSGPGVSKEEQERAFVRFYRSDAARDRQSGGGGLGLAIARAIIEAHGGSIALTGAAERGATVTIRLPADHDQAASASGS